MMISFIISPIERSLPHNLISPPMTLPLCLLPKKSLMRKSLRWKGGKEDKKRKKTERKWTKREVEDDAANGGEWAAQVDEEEVEEGGNVSGDEGDGVEEGVEEGGDKGSFELRVVDTIDHP